MGPLGEECRLPAISHVRAPFWKWSSSPHQDLAGQCRGCLLGCKQPHDTRSQSPPPFCFQMPVPQKLCNGESLFGVTCHAAKDEPHRAIPPQASVCPGHLHTAAPPPAGTSVLSSPGSSVHFRRASVLPTSHTALYFGQLPGLILSGESTSPHRASAPAVIFQQEGWEWSCFANFHEFLRHMDT